MSFSAEKRDEPALNPYQAPLSLCVKAKDECCSYCGRTAKAAGNLVQSPARNVYICEHCAEIASEILRSAKTPLWKVVFDRVMAIGFLGLVGAIAAFDAFLADEPQVTRWLTVPLMFLCTAAVVRVVYVAITTPRFGR